MFNFRKIKFISLKFEITPENNTNNIIKNLLNSHIYTTLNLTSTLIKFNIQNAYYSFFISIEINSSFFSIFLNKIHYLKICGKLFIIIFN